MENKKMTKREKFLDILTIPAVDANPDRKAFIEREIELLTKKNSGTAKLTKQQTENLDVKNAIYDGMEINRVYTVSELQKSIPAIAELSNQKVSALLRQMKDELRVERIEEKRKVYFKKIIV